MADKPIILVVDDQPEIRSIARRALEKAGYSIEDLASARKALDRLAAEPRPALIFLDVVMPEMDGWEFMRALAADASLPRVPIILTSSLADLENSKPPAGIEIAERLEKPFTPDGLVAAARKALSKGLAGRF